mgnify:CR=1 FL=1
MLNHHSEDYKVSAVKHYLNKTNNLTKTCEEFNCSSYQRHDAPWNQIQTSDNTAYRNKSMDQKA